MVIFTVVMGLTLAVAGVFLYRDYVRCLRGVHSVFGKVTSIQQVFIHQRTGTMGRSRNPFVKDGFYPVIEYKTPQGLVKFTAIDRNISGCFHVGDKLKLRVTKSRRRQNRSCKTFAVLVALVVALCASLALAAMFSEFRLATSQVLLASFVIAFCFSVLVVYVKDQDAHGEHEFTRSELGHAQICLFEPTAFGKWKTSLRDPAQLSKIRSTQFFGAVSLSSACVMLALAVQPFVLLAL